MNRFAPLPYVATWRSQALAMSSRHRGRRPAGITGCKAQPQVAADTGRERAEENPHLRHDDSLAAPLEGEFRNEYRHGEADSGQQAGADNVRE